MDSRVVAVCDVNIYALAGQGVNKVLWEWLLRFVHS